jgi:hypothetical protein
MMNANNFIEVKGLSMYDMATISDYEHNDSTSYKDVGSCRAQSATLLLPQASPKGTTLQFRIEPSDKRIPLRLFLDALVDNTDFVGEYGRNCHQCISVRKSVWQNCKRILMRYIADEYLQKDATLLLETSLFVNIQYLCAAYPVENNFIVDLTEESTGRVEFEFSSQNGGVEFNANAVWNHIDHYGMSGDFRWHQSTLAPVHQ